MSVTTGSGVGQDLLAVPFPEMVLKLGSAISESQFSLDMASFRVAQMMSGEDYTVDVLNEQTGEVEAQTVTGQRVTFGGEQLSLMELGFTPTFYQFVDTIIEVKMSVEMKRSTETKRSSFDMNTHAKFGVGFLSASAKLAVSTVSASFSSKYQYSAEGSSLIRTKLVPVPVPPVLEERIRNLITPPTTS